MGKKQSVNIPEIQLVGKQIFGKSDNCVLSWEEELSDNVIGAKSTKFHRMPQTASYAHNRHSGKTSLKDEKLAYMQTITVAF